MYFSPVIALYFCIHYVIFKHNTLPVVVPFKKNNNKKQNQFNLLKKCNNQFCPFSFNSERLRHFGSTDTSDPVGTMQPSYFDGHGIN